MNIEDLKQAIDQAEKVYDFVRSDEELSSLQHPAFVVWNNLLLYRRDKMEQAHAAEVEKLGAGDPSRITAQIVAESARQNVVMAAALMRMDRIMAEYHDDIEEAKRNE